VVGPAEIEPATLSLDATVRARRRDFHGNASDPLVPFYGSNMVATDTIHKGSLEGQRRWKPHVY
jgi:hypothetical protein